MLRECGYALSDQLSYKGFYSFKCEYPGVPSKWDEPINTYLPHFQIADPLVTEQITLHDLLLHRTGLPGNLYLGGRLWRRAYRSKEEIFKRVAHLELKFPFRSQCSYDNIGYMSAGEICIQGIRHALENFCTQRILTPLGMHRTTFSSPPIWQIKTTPFHISSKRRSPLSSMIGKGQYGGGSRPHELWPRYG